MKNTFFLIIFLGLFSCSDDNVDSNKFLPNVPVNFSVNLNLTEGINITTYGFNIFENQGIKGVIIFFDGLNYRAFDLACPHISLQECSRLNYNAQDVTMSCGCDNEKFSIIDGAPQNPDIQYAARQYIVTKEGSTLYIRN